MRRIMMVITSGIVLTALILGVIPVEASESECNIMETGNYLNQSCYYPDTVSNTATKNASPSLAIHEGEHLSFALSAIDPDNDSLVYSASNLPPGATFDPQTGTFSWIPGPGQRGSYPGIRFEVSDGELVDFEDITITVVTPEEAAFSLDSLRVRPLQVNAGRQVRISVIAENVGAVTGTYEVTLRINGTVEDNIALTLPAGAAEEVNFIVIKDIAGVYEVDVNGVSGSFTVKGTDDGRPAKKSRMMVIISNTVGWIQTILNTGGGA